MLARRGPDRRSSPLHQTPPYHRIRLVQPERECRLEGGGWILLLEAEEAQVADQPPLHHDVGLDDAGEERLAKEQIVVAERVCPGNRRPGVVAPLHRGFHAKEREADQEEVTERSQHGRMLAQEA